MALDRTNMVSLLDIGSLMNGLSENLVMLGDGFTDLSEDWGTKVSSTQYINQKTESTTINGYALSMSLSREYLSDEVQEVIDKMFLEFPTGKACETFYGRFLKSDVKTSGASATVKGIRVPIVVAPNSIGGGAGDTLTSGIEIHGNGEVVKGTYTITTSESGTTYSFAADED